jgi:hypothetical protein
VALHTISLCCEVGLITSFVLAFRLQLTYSVQDDPSNVAQTKNRSSTEVILYIIFSSSITIVVFICNVVGARKVFFALQKQTVATASLARVAVS